MEHADRPLIVMPTYNEADNLERIAAAVLEAAPQVHLLVVDDGSPDGTGGIADRLAASEPRLHVLHRTAKEGLGRAYVAGFRWGLERGYDRLIEMDADFSHDPAYLAPMLALSAHYDLVIGSRYVQGGGTSDWSLGRQLISRGGGLYARTVLGVRIQDLTAGFMCWRAEVLQALDLERIGSAGYGFQIEMKYRAVQQGWRVIELPIHFPDRTAGVSKMSSSIFTEALSLVWKLRLSGR